MKNHINKKQPEKEYKEPENMCKQKVKNQKRYKGGGIIYFSPILFF